MICWDRGLRCLTHVNEGQKDSAPTNPCVLSLPLSSSGDPLLDNKVADGPEGGSQQDDTPQIAPPSSLEGQGGKLVRNNFRQECGLT